ncbi:MAG: tetratricopeptide repeat protein [Bryobacteraceae bacterium]|nr:tetratricopeptide repeat protein [Bryobacteraceae bacterium]MDW8379491.1 tetratricopeptide repeat protein [Bryobacterales bacterium]
MSRLWFAALFLFTFLNACSQRRNELRAGARSYSIQPGTMMQRVMKRQVENALDAGDGDLEARQLRQRFHAEPNNVEIRLKLAEHYRKTGSVELAIEHLRLAAERFPRHEPVVVLLAELLLEQNELEEAVRYLEGYLQGGASASVAAWLGIVRDRRGEWKLGENAHRAALALVPTNANVRNNLGYNLLRQGRRQEAIVELRRAVSENPHLPAARNNLALALSRGSQQERQQALAEWRQMMDAAAAHCNFAASLIEQGAYSEARQQLDLALSLRPNFPEALYNLRLVSELEGKGGTFSVASTRNLSLAQSPPGNSGVQVDSALKAAMKKLWSVVAGTEKKPTASVLSAARSE